MKYKQNQKQRKTTVNKADSTVYTKETIIIVSPYYTKEKKLNPPNTMGSLMTPVSVSYTHLDVYKRQGWLIITRKKYVL